MLVKSDPRPISQQVMSGLRIGAFIIVLLVLTLLAMSILPVRHIQAYFWHLRHGEFVTFDNFRFPVPKHWLVQDITPGDVLIVNLDDGDGVLLHTDSYPVKLEVWSQVQHRVTESTTQITGIREFNVQGETLLCFETESDLRKFTMHSVNCRSDSGLEIRYSPILGLGKSTERFYSLVKQMRKSK